WEILRANRGRRRVFQSGWAPRHRRSRLCKRADRNSISVLGNSESWSRCLVMAKETTLEVKLAEIKPQLASFEEVEAYWASGRTPEEAAHMMSEYSIQTEDRIIYYLPGQEDAAKRAAGQ